MNMKHAWRALRIGTNVSGGQETAERADSPNAECSRPGRTESAGSLKPEEPSHQEEEQELPSPRQPSCDSLCEESEPPSTNSNDDSKLSIEGKSVPPPFVCPVSMEIMVDPVILATGHTYDRTSIERWFEQGHKTCPVTGMRLRHNELTPNFALRSAIQEWALANEISLPTRQAPPPQTPVFHWDESREGNVLPGHDEIVWALEARGNTLYTASADKTVRVWDVRSRRCTHVLEDHTRPVLSLALSDNSDRLFSGSYDYTIRVWNTSTMQRSKTLTGHTDAVRTLTVCNGRLFSGSYDGTIRVWDIDTLECLSVLTGHTGPVRTLVCSNGLIFSGSYDKTVRVWDATTLNCTGILKGHTAAVRALASSGSLVFSGSDDSTIRAWNTSTLQCMSVLEGHEDNVRVLAVGNGYVMSGSWDKTVRIWDIETLQCCNVLEGHTEAVLALAVGDDFVVSGSYDTTLRFWDVATWRCVRRCEGHLDAVRVLSAGEQGKVYSGSYDGSVGIW